ncbi:MAG: polyphosphate:AMP phosphotransferase [Acidobacteriota bacterium]
MFEAAELGRKTPKAEYKPQAIALRSALLAAQRKLTSAKFPVIIVFGGVDGAGKGETVNLLNEWLDPRWTRTRAYGEASDEERERPEYWRFWRDLPPEGRIGFFLNSWYSRPILDHVNERDDEAAFAARLERIVQFERTLTDDGALILKFWMHLGKAAQKQRLKKLEKDPLTRWRVTKLQWKHWRMYGRFTDAAELALRRTSTAEAPWTIIEGLDENYRTLTVATTIRDAIEKGLAQRRGEREAAPSAPGRAGRKSSAEAAGTGKKAATRRHGAERPTTILSRLDMTQKVAKNAFDTALEKQQGRLNLLQRRAESKGVSTIVVFEGWDAAGKGGVIRRITAALDARSYQVIPIAAPTDEERAQHYLWRFWRHLPRAGRVTMFDRSWYGRVLVERVEGFAAEPEWMRAYSEINEFEDELIDHGIVLVKCWMHVTSDEQLRRFKERETIEHKQWKLTDEDWRNREKWDAYELAVNDMIERTSTRASPWTLVEGNDKNFARLKVLKTLGDRLKAALDE